MPKFIIPVIQEFNCIYIVDADTKEQAVQALMNDGEGFCEEQYPEAIIEVIESEIEEF